MNDIDTRLERAGIRPRRGLRSDFTGAVLATLSENERPPKRRPKWMEYIPMKFLHKHTVAAAAAVAVIAVGGTAYAAVGGISGIRAFFSGEKTLSDGSRIVQVSAQACPHVDAFNITNKNRAADGKYYFRIKPASKLTDTQVVDIVQGFCEADAEGIANGKIMNQIEQQPENENQLVGGYADSVITAISSTSISIRSVIPHGSPQGATNVTADQTFPHIDSNAVVINDGAAENWSSLRVGDHVALTYRATGDALLHSETLAPDQINPSQQTVVVATRISKHMSEYFDYTKYNGRDFEEVAPCTTGPTGYCTAAEYQKHQ